MYCVSWNFIRGVRLQDSENFVSTIHFYYTDIYKKTSPHIHTRHPRIYLYQTSTPDIHTSIYTRHPHIYTRHQNIYTRHLHQTSTHLYQTSTPDIHTSIPDINTSIPHIYTRHPHTYTRHQNIYTRPLYQTSTHLYQTSTGWSESSPTNGSHTWRRVRGVIRGRETMSGNAPLRACEYFSWTYERMLGNIA